MSHSIALCVIIETKSKEYLVFKQKLQKNAQVRIIDTDGVKKVKGDKYVDKLSNTMQQCHAIVVICTPKLKSYLEGTSDSGHNLLGDKEKTALLKGLQNHQGKVILVDIKHDGAQYIPNDLHGLGAPVNGVEDIETLVDQIKAKKFGH